MTSFPERGQTWGGGGGGGSCLVWLFSERYCGLSRAFGGWGQAGCGLGGGGERGGGGDVLNRSEIVHLLGT